MRFFLLPAAKKPDHADDIISQRGKLMDPSPFWYPRH